MDELLNEFKCDFSSVRTVKISASLSAKTFSDIDNDSSVQNAMDTYLKKHKLDVTLLPNKKIKLSNLSTHASTNTTVSAVFTSTPTTSNEKSLDDEASQVVDFTQSEKSEEEEDGFEEDGEDDELDTTFETEQMLSENANFSASAKRSRKKREPSLKLQQKLSNADLELIVNSVCEKNASISIADVKKDNYVDKILKVELLDANTMSAIS